MSKRQQYYRKLPTSPITLEDMEEYEDDVEQQQLQSVNTSGSAALRSSTSAPLSRGSYQTQAQNHPQPSQNNASMRATRIPKAPTRTTKMSQKLVVFPDARDTSGLGITDVASDFGEVDESEESLAPQVVHYSYETVKEKEAERIRRIDKANLARVTAYCTAKYVLHQQR